MHYAGKAADMGRASSPILAPSIGRGCRAERGIFLARRYASHWRFYRNDALVLPVSAFSRASFIGLPEGFLDFARNDDTQETTFPHFRWEEGNKGKTLTPNPESLLTSH